MQLSTPVTPVPAPFRLTPQSHVLSLGSCFAGHVGGKLSQALPPGHVDVNPFGPIYAPRPMMQALDLLLDADEPPESTYFEGRDGLWHNRLWSGVASAPTLAACRAHTHAALDTARAVLRRADVVTLTLGTDRYYRTRTDGTVVTNCHKAPAADFEACTDTPEAIVARTRPTLARLRALRPEAHVVWTVSPYRYAKYGLHESQLSKARLLLAVDALCREDERSVYFPAYEIILDELRDYRFYARDLLHPSDLAGEIVSERYGEWCFDPALTRLAAERERLVRARDHRPLHPESDAHRTFREKHRREVQLFEEKWGFSPY